MSYVICEQTKEQISLISAFVVRCLDSLTPLLAVSKLSRLYLASEQASLSHTWSQTPEDNSFFFRDETHISFVFRLSVPEKEISFNPYFPSGSFHSYILDESIFNFRGVRCIFIFDRNSCGV